jgi:hypothetical protein
MESEIIRVQSSEEVRLRASVLRNLHFSEVQTNRFARFAGVSTDSEGLLVQPPLEVETRIRGRRLPSRSAPGVPTGSSEQVSPGGLPPRSTPGVPTGSSEQVSPGGLPPRSGSSPPSLSRGLGRSKSFELMKANDRATAAPSIGGAGVRQDLQRRLCRIEMRTEEIDNKVDHLANALETFQEKILAKLDMLVPT